MFFIAVCAYDFVIGNKYLFYFYLILQMLIYNFILRLYIQVTVWNICK